MTKSENDTRHKALRMCWEVRIEIRRKIGKGPKHKISTRQTPAKPDEKQEIQQLRIESPQFSAMINNSQS
jgi:hypothetical protein